MNSLHDLKIINKNTGNFHTIKITPYSYRSNIVDLSMKKYRLKDFTHLLLIPDYSVINEHNIFPVLSEYAIDYYGELRPNWKRISEHHYTNDKSNYPLVTTFNFERYTLYPFSREHLIKKLLNP